MVNMYSIPDFLMQWERIGVFDFILPFLLVFAIVFGILTSTRFLGGEKKIYVIISLVVALMTLRWSYMFSAFLTELFSRTGIALAIILSFLILVGMFINVNEARYWGWGLGALAGLFGLIILYQTFDKMGFLGYYGGATNETIGLVILGILLVVVVIAVVSSGERNTDPARGRATYITGWGGPPH